MPQTIEPPSPFAEEISTLRALANSFREQLQELEALEAKWELRRKCLWDDYFSHRIRWSTDLRLSPEEHDRQARKAFDELVAMRCPDALRYLNRGRPQRRNVAVESLVLATRQKRFPTSLPS